MGAGTNLGYVLGTLDGAAMPIPLPRLLLGESLIWAGVGVCFALAKTCSSAAPRISRSNRR